MAFGILEDHKTPVPMGTVVLDQVFGAAAHIDPNDPQFSHLKRDGHIVLQPQPSDDPNDPLNWSQKHKYYLAAFLMVVMTTVGAVNGMLGTATRIIAEKYHSTYPEVIEKMTPPYVASHAVALFFTSAIAAVWGKRIQYFGAIVLIWGVMLAGWFANSLNYYATIRVLEGLAAAPMDLLMAPIITDMVYIHQRGRLMALQAVVHVIGGDASHVIAGNIIHRLGVKYTFIISFAVIAPLVVLVYLFVWETTYTGKRPVFDMRKKMEQANQSGGQDSDSFELGDNKGELKQVETVDTKSLSRSSSQEDFGANVPKKTFAQQLKLWNGRLTNRSFFTSLWQPFPLMIFPAVLFSTIVNGAFLTWMVMSMIIKGQVLQYPPYNLKPDVLAYIGLPGSFMGMFSAVLAGYFNDRLITFMAKRNKGIYEPEYRLLAMLPATIFTTMGFTLVGPAYARHDSVPKLVAIGLLFHAGGPFASSATLTYIFDTHNNTSTEAFVATSLFKSIFIFFAAKYVPKWFAKVGPVKCFNTLAVLNVAFALLTIPMYIYGKRLRGWVTRRESLHKWAKVKN